MTVSAVASREDERIDSDARGVPATCVDGDLSPVAAVLLATAPGDDESRFTWADRVDPDLVGPYGPRQGLAFRGPVPARRAEGHGDGVQDPIGSVGHGHPEIGGARG